MRGTFAALVFLALAAPASAHDGIAHPGAEAASAHEAAAGPPLPLPVQIEARFALTDQSSRAVTQADFAGRPMVLFFGYANCQSICSVALPAMAAALEILGHEGAAIAPVLVTVDPARDTPAALAEALPRYHPRLIGLTGSGSALADARAAFQVETSRVAALPEVGPVYAHGSFLYLIGPDGVVRAVLPPILAPERIAELMRKYLLG